MPALNRFNCWCLAAWKLVNFSRRQLSKLFGSCDPPRATSTSHRTTHLPTTTLGTSGLRISLRELPALPCCTLTQHPSSHNASPRLPERPHRVFAHGSLLWVRPTPPLPTPSPRLTGHRGAPANIDQVVSDFDGVTFHISTPESKTKILVSLQIKCFSELVQYGAQAVLEREYGPYIVSPESGYDFSVLVDLENLPEDKGMIRRLGS